MLRDIIILYNSREDLSFTQRYKRVFRDYELNDDPYFGVTIECNYHDVNSLALLNSKPLFLSINCSGQQKILQASCM